MIKYISALRRLIILILVLSITAVLLYSTAHVVYSTFINLINIPFVEFSSDSIVSIFGSLLIILIGVELLETVKIFLKDDVVHVEIVILVAIIAIARKVITWDYSKYSFEQLIGLAVMLLALSAGYYLIKKSDASK